MSFCCAVSLCQLSKLKFEVGIMIDRLQAGLAGFYEPGQYVTHPDCPDWGIGQVQSVSGLRVTVNFEHSGKVLVNTAVIELIIID